MGEPLTVIIPHRLGKAEAMARLKSGIEGVRKNFAGKLSVLEEQWVGDELRFRVGLLGQVTAGTITAGEENVRLAVELPWLLAKLAEKAKALIERQGQLMLERKNS
jgi:hypothetical protein